MWVITKLCERLQMCVEKAGLFHQGGHLCSLQPAIWRWGQAYSV